MYFLRLIRIQFSSSIFLRLPKRLKICISLLLQEKERERELLFSPFGLSKFILKRSFLMVSHWLLSSELFIYIYILFLGVSPKLEFILSQSCSAAILSREKRVEL